MEFDTSDATISGSKEESILKALEMMASDETPPPPIKRPDISTSRTLLVFFVWLISVAAVSCVISFVEYRFSFPNWVIFLSVILIFVVVIAFKAKSMLCSFVLLYQKHAPEGLRRACVFTPTCSEYMLLAIEKYGVVKGFFKGVARLCRCHYPNGGVDNP